MKTPRFELAEVYFIRPSLRWPLILVPSWLVSAGYSVYYFLLLILTVDLIDNRLRAIFVLLVSINGVVTYLLIGYLQVIRKITAKNLLLDLLRDCPNIIENRYSRWSINIVDPGIKRSEDIKQLKRLKHRDILEVLERSKRKNTMNGPFK